MESDIYALAESAFSGVSKFANQAGQAADDLQKAKQAVSLSAKGAIDTGAEVLTGIEKTTGLPKRVGAGLFVGGTGVGAGAVGAEYYLNGGDSRINQPEPVRPGESNRIGILQPAKTLAEAQNIKAQPLVVSGNNNVINELYEPREERIGGRTNTIPFRYDSQTTGPQPRMPMSVDRAPVNPAPYLSAAKGAAKPPSSTALAMSAKPGAPFAPTLPDPYTPPVAQRQDVQYKPLVTPQSIAPAPVVNPTPSAPIQAALSAPPTSSK